MPKIMIIEDDQAIREELVLLLENEGYTAIAVTDFTAILDQAAWARPDLILLDVGLPGRDGFFLCASLRKAVQAPVVFVTSRNSSLYEVLALCLRPEEFRTSIDDAVNLRRINLSQIGDLRNARFVTSVWDRENERISDSPFDRGRRVITFNNILKYNTFPLAEIVSDILRIGAEEMRCPVEVEFAVNMDVAPGRQRIFNLLQIRPIIDNQDNRPIDWSEVDTSEALIYGENALGIGRMSDIADIVYIKEGAFSSLQTERIADELLRFNTRAHEEKRPYILVGPGRWGSSDPFLGVPVKWTHISEAKVIVECGIRQFEVEPSQGTHFFQNVTSLGIGYLTISPHRGDGVFRADRLDAMEAVAEGEFLRQVRFDRPLRVVIDGRSNRGIVSEAASGE